MAIKRNRWLVGGILFIAVAALLAVSLGPLIQAAFDQPGNGYGDNAANTAASPDRQAELEGRANGYELVLEREPDNQAALEGLVEARIGLEDLSGAVEPLARLAELNPQEPRYAVLLAQAKQELEDLEGAAQTYRSVLTANPGNMEALQGLIALLIEQERPQAAVGLLQDTLKTAEQSNKIQPGTIDVIAVKLLLGQVYAEQSRYDDAIAIYDTAIQDAQNLGGTPDFRPTLAKGLILRETGKEAEARPLFETALSLAPVQFKDRIQQLIDQGAVETAPSDGATGETPGGTSDDGTTDDTSVAPDTAEPEAAPASEGQPEE
ncbi:tetratricopeptide repeat protein [Leptolyngbya cf. ectocarpi LEGE 11479]|uniref:Tetratricopeptide repeat protein n=1 Tax=Leptolyngbya cf. ectocarpi LEGE 11479 TaxID=1828722 RepID=A0A928WY45_LEPEC|nr:tetratricopeptide repeat protein [Leptolyngbya ectocarpi]MBE9065467.1 tetratricopeptide repeat protein [Leptolyngbya cf. ectocarpi LEGE 11479]